MATEDLDEYAAKVTPLFENKDRRDIDTVHLLLTAMSGNHADRVQYLLDLGQQFLDASPTGLVYLSGIHVFSRYMTLEVALVFVRYYNNASEEKRLRFRTAVSRLFRVSAFIGLAKSSAHTDIAIQFFKSIGCVPIGAHGGVLIECGRADIYPSTELKETIREMILFIDSEKEQERALLTVSQELLETCKVLQAENAKLTEQNGQIAHEKELRADLQEQVKTLEVELKSSQDIKTRIREILRKSSVLNE